MSKAWKALERRIAKRFGTFRTPLSGMSSRHTASDTLHQELYIEVKWSGILDSKGVKQITIKRDWLEEARKNAKDENKIPMLMFSFKGDKEVWTILPIEVIEMLYMDKDVDNEHACTDSMRQDR